VFLGRREEEEEEEFFNHYKNDLERHAHTPKQTLVSDVSEVGMGNTGPCPTSIWGNFSKNNFE
jgi:hypothetical protein